MTHERENLWKSRRHFEAILALNDNIKKKRITERVVTCCCYSDVILKLIFKSFNF